MSISITQLKCNKCDKIIDVKFGYTDLGKLGTFINKVTGDIFEAYYEEILKGKKGDKDNIIEFDLKKLDEFKCSKCKSVGTYKIYNLMDS